MRANEAMTAASKPDGVTGQLVTWIHELAWDDVPDKVRARAAHLVLDGLGCALVGAQLPWSRVATEAVLGVEGSGDAVVIGTGRTTTPAGAALLNSTYIQGFELDDFHPRAPLHTASLVVPSQIPALIFVSERGTMGEFNLGQALVCKTMRPVLDSLAVENITITRHDELAFILDRSIKQAVATQAPVTFILSPLLTGGKVFKQ